MTLFKKGHTPNGDEQKYYSVDIGDSYISTFNNAVRDEFKNQSKDGSVIIDFNRLYYIGKKM